MRRLFLGIGLLFGSCFAGENALLVTYDAHETVAWDRALIAHAEHSIEVSGAYCGGTVFREMMAVAREAMERHPALQFHLITHEVMFDPEDFGVIASFRAQFPTRFHCVFPTDDIAFWPDLKVTTNHVKVLIVDEKYFVVGGTNREEAMTTVGTSRPARKERQGALRYMPGGLRDMDVVGYGPAAYELRRNFFYNFAVWEGYHAHGKMLGAIAEDRYFALLPERSTYAPELETSARLRPGVSLTLHFASPFVKPNTIGKEYERLIRGARQSVVFANLYFNPPEYILEAAMDAANRGVALTVFTNGIYPDSPDYNILSMWANRVHYVPLFFGREFRFWEAITAAFAPVRNTRIFEYRVPDILYHKKLMVVDGRTTFIGSYNLGKRSEESDFELNIEIDSPAVAADILAVLETDRTYSEEVSEKLAREWYFNPITSYLGGSQKGIHGMLSTAEEESARPEIPCSSWR